MSLKIAEAPICFFPLTLNLDRSWIGMSYFGFIFAIAYASPETITGLYQDQVK